MPPNFLRRLLGGTVPLGVPDPRNELEPHEPFIAVGDLHGCPELFLTLLATLDQCDPGCPLIFVGDYIDRGERSAEMLTLLRDMEQTCDRTITCLRGNHEQMLIDFLDDPEVTGSSWLSNGGLMTLWGFGIDAGGRLPTAAKSISFRDLLRERIGVGLEDWLRQRPLTWRSGNIVVSHAGIDPAVDLESQSTEALLWGQRGSDRRRQDNTLWSVQGHTIVESAFVDGRSIFIDTGAYATSRLSAVHISREGLEFFQTD